MQDVLGHSINRVKNMLFDYKDSFLEAIKHILILFELVHSYFFK